MQHQCAIRWRCRKRAYKLLRSRCVIHRTKHVLQFCQTAAQHPHSWRVKKGTEKFYGIAQFLDRNTKLVQLDHRLCVQSMRPLARLGVAAL